MAKDSDLNIRLAGELNNPENVLASRQVLPYSGSNLQMETYKSLQQKDLAYQQFLAKKYGSYENFLKATKINQDIHVFDPTTDYIIDVTVIKPNTSFKTDHISSYEVILENMSGVCTVFFTKNDGSTRKLTCTLESQYVPNGVYNQTRAAFFSPMAGDRIGVWDLNEQKWKSFYMSRVFKFIRDDTQSIE